MLPGIPAKTPENAHLYGRWVRIHHSVLMAAVDLITDHPRPCDRPHLDPGYHAGYSFGFDHGYSARQDYRAFVHGVINGFADGCREQREFAHHLLTSLRKKARRG